MDKRDKPVQQERTEKAISKGKRIARQRGLRFSGKTSEQFQQEIQAAAIAESLEGKNVSEREVLSGDHSNQSDSSWEPEPPVRPTETRPTKKRKAMADEAPSENQPNQETNRAFGEAGSSRPRSYEEWKNSEEGQDPRLKPVRSPGRDRDNEQEGQIYSYDTSDWSGFCEKTEMQKRLPEDQIKRRVLNRVVNGEQLGAGKGERKWTSPDPAIQEKVQGNLMRMRKNRKNKREKIRSNVQEEKEYLMWKRDKSKKEYKKYSKRVIEKKIKKRQEMKENNPKEYEKRLSRANERTRERRQEMKENNFEEYKKRLSRTNERTRERRQEMKENNSEEYKKYLSRKNQVARERSKKLREDYDYLKEFLWKKYEKNLENHKKAMNQLKTSMENASQEELQKEEQDLISQWDTFQKQYRADLDKLAQLFQQRELQQSQQYMAIEGELETLIQRYLDKNDELEPHELEDDLLNEGADLSPHDTNRTFGEAESSRPQDYDEWKNSEEGQDPDLKPVRSPGGQIYGYDSTDWSGFLKKTNMRARSLKDQIKKKGHLSNVVLGRQTAAGNWTSPDPTIQRKRQENADKDRIRKMNQRNRLAGSEKHEERLISESCNRLMKSEKFNENSKYRKRKLQELMGKPEYCKAFFKKFLKRGYERKKKQYESKMYQIDTAVKQARLSQVDEGGSRGKFIKRVLQQAKQDLKSQWDNFQERYHADQKKLDKLIHQLEQLQRAPEQGPSLSERDEPSNQQQRELPQRQLHMAIGGELETLIQKYGSNDDEFGLSKLDGLELYDLGESEIHNLENDLLNDFADLDASSSSDV